MVKAGEWPVIPASASIFEIRYPIFDILYSLLFIAASSRPFSVS
jgi:hypothetical protein